jgi:hypothetical protein
MMCALTLSPIAMKGEYRSSLRFVVHLPRSNSKHITQSTPHSLFFWGVPAHRMLTCLMTQTMEQFKDFESYVKGVNSYGMQSGIVLIDPPEEW